MACIPAPTVTPPTLSGGLSVTPPALSSPSIAGACCKLPPLPNVPVNLPLPAAVLDPLVASIKQATSAVLAYLDAIPLKCPRE